MPDLAMPPMIVPFRFSLDDYIVVDATAYRLISSDHRGHLMRRLEPDGEPAAFTHAELHAAHIAGKLTVRERWLSAEALRARETSDAEHLSDLPEEERHTTLWRAEWCDRFLCMEQDNPTTVSRSDRSMALAIPVIHAAVSRLEMSWDGHAGAGKTRVGRKVAVSSPPSPGTLRRWLRAYEAAGYNAVGLRENWRRCGNQRPRTDMDSHVFAMERVRRFLDSRRPTRRMVYEDYQADLHEENRRRHAEGTPPLAEVSRRTFYRQISRLDPYHVDCGRLGRDAARRRHRITNAGLRVDRPLQRVEIDECRLSLQVLLTQAGAWPRMTAEQKRLVERIRPWVTLAIDAATRCIMALRIFVDAPSSDSAIAAIEMVVGDKTHLGQVTGAQAPWSMCGIPEQVSMDSGAAFIARETKTVLRSLGVTAHHPPAKEPEMRARVERVFGTLQGHFVKYFSGQTFENVVVRGEYDAEGNAAIDVEELNRTLVRWVVDAYHCSPHAGLAGETPISAWKRLTAKYGVRPPPDRRARRAIFGISCRRRIQGKGVRVLGIHFQSAEIQRLRRTTPEVEVRVDRFNLGEISVGTDEGWLTVRPAIRGLDLDGVTWWEWLAAAADLRRRHAETTDLSAPVVREALSAIRREGQSAMARAELGSPVIGNGDLERAEKDLFLTFAFQDGGEPGADLLEGVEPAGLGPNPGPHRHQEAPEPPDGHGRWRNGRTHQFEIIDQEQEEQN